MKPRLWLCSSVVTLLLAVPLSSSAADLRAGVAVVDITPPQGFRMSGYFYERFNTGTKDPLNAKALVFQQGEQQAAIVFCDLIGISLEVAREARKLASAKTGIPAENIAITATHSHTGPLYFGGLRDYFHERAMVNGRDPAETVDYSETLTQRVVEAITQAHGQLLPVELVAGVGQETRLSFNRRFHMKDGTVRFNPGQLNADIVRVAGPIDPEVGLLRLKSNREDLAILTVFALHLDTVGGTEYSADYPYHLEESLRKKLGDGVVSLFGAGTCGDINHIDVSTKNVRKADTIGPMLAETVLGALDELSPIEEPALAVRSVTIDYPKQQYSAEQVEKAQARMEKIGKREMPFLEEVETNKIFDLHRQPGNTIPLEVQVFRLSDEVAIVTLPGEVFVEIGLAIKQASPFPTTMVIELANTTPAYIPTRKAFAEGSYETVNSRIRPGGGEAMVEAAIKLLKELKR